MPSIRTPWFHFLVALVLMTTLAACGGDVVQRDDAVTSASSVSRQPGGEANRSEATVNIVAKEFAFSLDTSQTSAGTITFIVKNEGFMPHDFAITGNGVERKTALIDPGDTASLTVELKPGTYTYVCTVPGHAPLGMRGTFTVS